MQKAIPKNRFAVLSISPIKGPRNVSVPRAFLYVTHTKGGIAMKFRSLLLITVVLLAGCSQETDRQTAVDDLAEKVIAEKAEQKKQAEQEKEEKKQIESVGRTKAERVVEAYLLSETAKDRARFVLNPRTALPRMEKYYRDSNLRSLLEINAISRVDGEGDPKSGKYGEYRADVASGRGSSDVYYYYVKNTRGGMKIDWEAATGYNEMSWNAFKVSRPTKPVTMRVEAVLSDYYNYAFANAERTHYSISFGLELVSGYVRKDSRLGKRLFDTLKDGEEHNLILSIRFLPNSYGNTVLIDELVSEDWLIR